MFIDDSIVKAHQHSFGTTSHPEGVISKSVADNSSKSYLVADTCGNFFHIAVTSGQLHDSQIANVLISRAIEDDTAAVLADKRYDSPDIRNHIMHYDSRCSNNQALRKYGGMNTSLITRLEDLEAENTRLKKV